MSFRSSSGESGRAFECVRRSLLLADELPFANVLMADRLAEAFESEGIDFANADAAPDVIYTPAVTLWAFLSQMLFTGEQRSRVVALISLATAMVSGFAMGPYSGKETGETALFRQLWELLKPGDVVVADRYYAGWFLIALLQELGVDVVTRLHQLREADFRRGRRLGADDHLVEWPKPQRSDWLDQETYNRLPDRLCVREMKFAVRERGFRTQSMIVVTTLRDDQEVTREDLADLYRQRWHAELDLRSLKSTMALDVLRCQTPEMVRTELWMGLLAYNLVRHSLLQAAAAATSATAAVSPRQLSFCAGMQFLATTWLTVTTHPGNLQPLIDLRLRHLASHPVGHRPNRIEPRAIEPRAIKRRPTSHDLLTQSRAAARAKLLTGCST